MYLSIAWYYLYLKVEILFLCQAIKHINSKFNFFFNLFMKVETFWKNSKQINSNIIFIA